MMSVSSGTLGDVVGWRTAGVLRLSFGASALLVRAPCLATVAELGSDRSQQRVAKLGSHAQIDSQYSQDLVVARTPASAPLLPGSCA